MKFIVFVFLMATSFAMGQIPRPPRPVTNISAEPQQLLDSNYLIKIVTNDSGKQVLELSFITAVTTFSVDAVDGKMLISGSLTPEADGAAFLLRYVFSTTVETSDGGAHGFQQRSQSSAVRLHLGDTVQILKSGTAEYKITLSRLPEEAKNKK